MFLVFDTSLATLLRVSSLGFFQDTEWGGTSPHTTHFITPSPVVPSLNVWPAIDAPIAFTSVLVSMALESFPVQVATHLSSSLKTGLFAVILNWLFFSVSELESDVSVMVARSKSPSIAVVPDKFLVYSFRSFLQNAKKCNGYFPVAFILKSKLFTGDIGIWIIEYKMSHGIPSLLH